MSDEKKPDDDQIVYGHRFPMWAIVILGIGFAIAILSQSLGG